MPAALWLFLTSTRDRAGAGAVRWGRANGRRDGRGEGASAHPVPRPPAAGAERAGGGGALFGPHPVELAAGRGARGALRGCCHGAALLLPLLERRGEDQ